ncbi:MAG TPA: hypothetical protein VF432_26625 [Thermoanaerobaculia bacterium]
MRTIVAVLLLATGMSAADSPWRTYAGGYSTSWKTDGWHGHDQPCYVVEEGSTVVRSDSILVRMPAERCDGADFGRGNLDNSIGFRFGRERDFASLGALRITGGYDTTLSDTEYNISQRDLVIFSGAAVGGVDLERWGGRIGVRYGIGSFFTTDFRYGVHSFKEFGLTLPLGPGSAIRLTRGTAVHSGAFDQRFRLAGMSRPSAAAMAKEFGLLLITRPGDAGPSRWNFSAMSGVSAPRDLNLSRAGFHRLSVVRDLGATPLRLQFSWTSSAHESQIEGVFNGYPRNLRSKTIDSFGVALRVQRDLGYGLSVHGTAGGEVAEWTDPHGLLVTGDLQNRRVVKGGIEPAANAGAAVRWLLGRGVGIEVMGEQAYWPGIGLTERRTGVGLVVSR